MVLELHVLGPAFSLPSIDASCIASIAYCKRTVPPGEWVLVPSYLSGSSQTELPALHDGSARICGFHNIVVYLRERSDVRSDLDAHLGPEQEADKIAFAAFLEARGQPLLDLSLYVSSQNYSATTRPAYSSILPWPTQFLAPPKIRAAAKSRSEHLGLSSLDIDTEADQAKDDQTGQPSSVIPTSLLKRPKATVTSLLGRTEHAQLLRLDALTVAFLEPLRDRLGDKTYMLSTASPSSLDCLTLGYLSLALLPDLPQPWLSQTMRTKFPALCDFVHRGQDSLLGGPAVAGRVAGRPSPDSTVWKMAEPASTNKGLPWAIPEALRLSEIGGMVFDELAESVPVLSNMRATARLRTESEDGNLSSDQIVPGWKARLDRDSVAQVALLVAGASTLFAGVLYSGVLPNSSVRATATPVPQSGAADNVLSMFADHMDRDFASQVQHASEQAVTEELDLQANASRVI